MLNQQCRVSWVFKGETPDADQSTTAMQPERSFSLCQLFWSTRR